MRVVMPHDEVSVAVAAVVAHGFVAVEGTKTQAVPFCRRVIEALETNDEVVPITSYQNVTNRGYLYLVLDAERYPLDRRAALKAKVAELDRLAPG